MPAMATNSSSMGAMWQYMQMMTQNNSVAASWAGNVDMSDMPRWARQYVAENVMYTRTFLAANLETLNEDGSAGLGNAGSAPLMVPVDITSGRTVAHLHQEGTPEVPHLNLRARTRLRR